MAIQKKNHLAGLIGNVVFYERNGIPCSRSRPGKVKQTRASRAASKIFGRASTISAQLRSGLSTVLPDTKKDTMRYRFDTAIRQWLSSLNSESSPAIGFSYIDRFQFNEKSSLTDRLRLPLTVDRDQPGKLIINIPALIPSRDIIVPPFTEKISWVIEAVSCTVAQTSLITQQCNTSLSIKYDDKTVAAKRIELPFKEKSGELGIIVLGLRYTVTKKGETVLLNDEAWMPAGVIHVNYQAK